jgi:O-antigen ligase
MALLRDTGAAATKSALGPFYRYLTYALLVLLPTYRWLNLPLGAVGLSVIDVMILIGGLCLIAELLLTRGLPLINNRNAALGIAIFLGAALISGLQAQYRGLATVFLASLVLKMILFYMVFRVTTELSDLRPLLMCYVVAAGAMGVVVLFQQFDASRLSSDPLSAAGTLDARNELTFYLAPAAVLSVSLAVGARNRAVALALFAVVAAALVLSRGRAGTFFALAGVLTYLALVARRAGKRRLAVATIIGLLFTSLLAWWITTDSASSIRYRYMDSFLVEVDEERGSTYARLLILEGLWQAWQENFWFGIGANNFKEKSTLYVDFYGTEVQPHNSYMGTLAELGLVGFIGLLLALLPALKTALSRTYKHPLEITLGVGVAYAVVLAHLMTFDAIARYPLWIFAGICYGIAKERSVRVISLS